MRCLSTRAPKGAKATVSLCEAIAQGLAPDGGLYVPEELTDVSDLLPRPTLAETAHGVLAPYFYGEPLMFELEALCRAAFTFEAPLRKLAGDDFLLELFHGPTAAFKDFGARFLAECLARLPPNPVQPERSRGQPDLSTILVATSGDTGAAVAAAFHRRPGFRVVILYPDGRVSARQAHQLGAFGDNVHTFRVAGTFDDCQKLVKAAFSEEALRPLALTSANSISLGRLLPQLSYYAKAALDHPGANFVVPTGNLGNALACLMARDMGLPIGRVVLATNSNRVVPEFLASGRYEPKPGIATLANAMDVGAPSNLERLRYWHSDAELSKLISADWVDDAAIRETISRTWQTAKVAICPHTACGVEVLRRLRAKGEAGTWIVAATAHPAKFDTIVEPLIGERVEPPAPLAALLARPSKATPLEADAGALRAALLALP